MPSSSTRRPARWRRALTTSAAAVAVILATAACDAAAGSPDRGDAPATDGGYGSSSYGAGHSEHSGAHEDAPRHVHPVVVPVGNTTEPDAPPAQDDEPEDEPVEPVKEDDKEKDGEKPTGEDAAKPEDKSATKIDILGDDCSDSELDPHDGFQKAQRCVSTAFGEVAEDSPSLLITSAPTEVTSGAEFPITVSTRNLVRDRFLKAADGGYYAESSFVNAEGLQRGHFHTACRMLTNTDVAPDAEPVPAFFSIVEDNGGGAAPDSVIVPITGLTEPGIAQCAVWAGDGSHRVPMMVRADQTPAFDVVRITVQ